MKRELAIAIGVGNAKPLKYLAGAINGANAFHDWAQKAGYQSSLLTDEDEASPVTMDRLRRTLEVLISGDKAIHRLVIYFAGHGLIREAEEGLWLLSDWQSELRAVAVEVLKRRLAMYYQIEQIAIFADCCRSLPKDMSAADLTADGVIGLGPSRPTTRPAIDKFVAAQDGTETFVVPGDSPEEDRCLFSGLLMEGLWGVRENAFSKQVAGAITSRSLGNFLQVEVPQLASRYGRSLTPTVSPTFPEGDDIYFKSGLPGPPPVFQPWPPPKFGMMLLLASADSAEVAFESIAGHGAKRATTKTRKASPRRVDHDSVPKGLDCGFVVRGQDVVSVWTPPNIIVEVFREANCWRISNLEGRLHYPVPILIEFSNGNCAAVNALPDFVGRINCDGKGVSVLLYSHQEFGESDATIASERALAAMENGNLQVSALQDLAVEFRYQKHIDPVYGVIAAYLYDSIGDVANIRRMAYYYTSRKQPIPYDIALLGQLESEWRDNRLFAFVPKVPEQKPRTQAERRHNWTYEATDSATGEVAGFWPWMRQGWAFLDDPSDFGLKLIHPELVPLRESIQKCRFATLDINGGMRLAQLVGIVPNHFLKSRDASRSGEKSAPSTKTSVKRLPKENSN